MGGLDPSGKRLCQVRIKVRRGGGHGGERLKVRLKGIFPESISGQKRRASGRTQKEAREEHGEWEKLMKPGGLCREPPSPGSHKELGQNEHEANKEKRKERAG